MVGVDVSRRRLQARRRVRTHRRVQPPRHAVTPPARARRHPDPATPGPSDTGTHPKMPRATALLFSVLLLAAALPATPGLRAPQRKDKRGWTLNSAGYLLGPHAIDNHRSFPDQSSLAGKRELQPEDDGRPGSFHRPLAKSDAVRTVLELLDILRVRDARVPGSPPDVPSAVPDDKALA
ncbi:galanin peptides [Sorex araneus]|uniref:galanin peptides n=1 Tax=Sorex araneus TaxID=42254 RepID=UPI002433C08F|nr:galanin peptides [Sorex araneus]